MIIPVRVCNASSVRLALDTSKNYNESICKSSRKESVEIDDNLIMEYIEDFKKKSLNDSLEHELEYDIFKNRLIINSQLLINGKKVKISDSFILIGIKDFNEIDTNVKNIILLNKRKIDSLSLKINPSSYKE